MANESPTETIKRYLEDAIAVEQNFETQLRTNAKDSDQLEAQALFLQHAEETKLQHQRLTARLVSLGGKPSGVKGMFSQLFAAMPKLGQIGQAHEDRNTQNLVVAFAAENSEIAMYETLAVSAAAAGDTETEQLARAIQDEERLAAEKVWRLLAPSARDSFMRMTSSSVETRMAA